MLPTGRTFKALTGFRRALVPDTLQVWGKKEAATGTRQIKKWEGGKRKRKRNTLFVSALLHQLDYSVGNHFSAVLPLF